MQFSTNSFACLCLAACALIAQQVSAQNSPAAASKPQTPRPTRSEEHTSELQSRSDLVCRLLLEKKKNATFHIKTWKDGAHHVLSLTVQKTTHGRTLSKVNVEPRTVHTNTFHRRPTPVEDWIMQL